MTDQLSPLTPNGVSLGEKLPCPAAILDDPVPLTTGAAFAGVNPRTVRRWVDNGLISGYRFGPRAIRVSLREIASMGTPIEAVGKAAVAVADAPITDESLAEYVRGLTPEQAETVVAMLTKDSTMSTADGAADEVA